MRTGVRILVVATAGLVALLGAVPAFAGAPLGSAPAPVPVGPGLADASARQVVRTAAGRVYVFAVDDDGPLGTIRRIRVYRATATGIPKAFAEVAVATRPSRSPLHRSASPASTSVSTAPASPVSSSSATAAPAPPRSPTRPSRP